MTIVIPHFIVETEPVQWRLTDITDNWAGRGGHVISLQWLFVALAVCALCIAVLQGRRWYLKQKMQPGPQVVFRRIARAAGIRFADRLLMQRIARQQQLYSPLTLFFSQSTLDHHTEQFLSSLPKHQHEHIRMQVTMIGQLLFEV